jgi:hypothetical protein
MFEYQYSVKNQGYLLRITCEKCHESELTIVKIFESKKEEELFENYIDSIFSGWTKGGAGILCPGCTQASVR